MFPPHPSVLSLFLSTLPFVPSSSSDSIAPPPPPHHAVPPSPLHLPSPSSLSLKVSETEMSGDLSLARTENKSLFSPWRASIDDPRPFAYTYLLLSNTFLILLLQVCRSSRLPCVFPQSSRRADALNVCAIRGAPLISSSRENNAPFA